MSHPLQLNLTVHTKTKKEEEEEEKIREGWPVGGEYDNTLQRK